LPGWRLRTRLLDRIGAWREGWSVEGLIESVLSTQRTLQGVLGRQVLEMFDSPIYIVTGLAVAVALLARAATR